MKINNHIHTNWSGDVRKNYSGGTPKEFAEAAKKAGFGEITITDHLAVGYPNTAPSFSHSMDVENLGEYFKDIESAAKDFPEVAVEKASKLTGCLKRLMKLRKFSGNIRLTAFSAPCIF